MGDSITILHQQSNRASLPADKLYMNVSWLHFMKTDLNKSILKWPCQFFTVQVFHQVVPIINLYYNYPYVLLSPSPLWRLFLVFRPSSGPIALRNVLKCSTWHTFYTISFWHFSSAAFIEENAERVPILVYIIMLTALLLDCPRYVG